jgi:hypothetical protein
LRHIAIGSSQDALPGSVGDRGANEVSERTTAMSKPDWMHIRLPGPSPKQHVATFTLLS